MEGRRRDQFVWRGEDLMERLRYNPGRNWAGGGGRSLHGGGKEIGGTEVQFREGGKGIEGH